VANRACQSMCDSNDSGRLVEVVSLHSWSHI
jgi:hypothetical protein